MAPSSRRLGNLRHTEGELVMRSFAFALSVFASAAVSPGAAAAQDASPVATPEFAIIEVALLDADGEEVGTAEITQLTDGGVGFAVAVDGLEPGDHGIHVHETGVCEPGGDQPFASAGGHFNPGDAPHGGPPDEGDGEAHAGDLGNIAVGADGTAEFSSSSDRVTLAEGEPTSLADGDGSALLIHADPDDLESQPAGDSGARIVCGVIAPPTDAGTPAAGTPVAQAGLAVTLLADRDRAGPRDLTVLVHDAADEPVADAEVTVETRSLEMDHGVRTTAATAAGRGRYVAAGIPMGMTGDWRVEVGVARAGAAPAVFVFVLALEGPR